MKRFKLGGAVVPLLFLLGTGTVLQLSHFEDKRSLQKEEELLVKVHFSQGDFSLHAGEKGELYSLELDYDKRTMSKMVNYRTEGKRGILEVEVKGRRGLKLRRKEKSYLFIEVTPGLPISLDLSLGASEATVDLSGLRIADLKLDVGAGDVDVYFDQPNPEPLRRMQIEAGVSELKTHSLGNANFQYLLVEGGMGDFLLDFRGNWQKDARAEIEMGIGSLDVKLPRDLGVKLIFDKSFLCSLNVDSFIKDGNQYTSENYKKARHHLTLKIEAGVGDINIEWME
ncbi:MAG: hypothetical protein ACETWC_10430 [Acidobacteriota bacterium]